MRVHPFLLSLCACGGTLKNAAPEAISTSPVPPGFDRFQSARVIVKGVTSIAAGADVTCGLRTDGVVLCVGNGHLGAWTLRTR